MEVLTLIALVKKLVDFARFLRARNADGIFTQLAAWGAGFAGLALYVHSDFGAGFTMAGHSLAHAAWPTLLLAGMSIGSGGSIVADVIAGVDSNRSTAIPSLVSGTISTALAMPSTLVTNVAGPPAAAVVTGPPKRTTTRKR